MKKPRILLWDIETSFNLATVFSLYQDRGIPYTALLQERYILCAAFKEHGKPGVWGHSLHHYTSWDEDHRDDEEIVWRIYDELKGADAIVAHYGDAFDIKFFNSRAVYHGLPPLPPIIQIDTYKIAKQKFKFNSNRLDYLGEFLGCGRKLKTDHSLWMGCWEGDEKAMEKMYKYNKQDVVLLDQVFSRLVPYVPSKVNYSLFNHEEVCCPVCGSTNYIRDERTYTRRGVFQRYECKDCMHWFQGSKNLNTTSKVK